VTSNDWLSEIATATPTFAAFEAKKRKRAAHASPPILPHIVVPLLQWDGEVGPWEDHFGKGRKQCYPLTGVEPMPSCIEVEVVKQLRRHCQHAFWVSCFNADKLPTRWRPYALALRELPPWLREIDRDIRTRIASASGGVPDAVGWNDESPKGSALFLECKAIGETIKESQQDWVTDAIAKHFSASQFAVALRPF
jgi:hypothetical protein